MTRQVTLPDTGELLRRLVAVDEDLRPFAPYLFPWAKQTIKNPWKLVAIIETAIEQRVEDIGSLPSSRGALVHFAPEIVEALAGRNGFADEVKKDLKELLDVIGRGRR